MTEHISQDDLIRRWSSDCSISWDDNPGPEGGCIAVIVVLLFVAVTLGSFLAVVTQ